MSLVVVRKLSSDVVTTFSSTPETVGRLSTNFTRGLSIRLRSGEDVVLAVLLGLDSSIMAVVEVVVLIVVGVASSSSEALVVDVILLVKCFLPNFGLIGTRALYDLFFL